VRGLCEGQGRCGQQQCADKLSRTSHELPFRVED
jgi:hypothetical protein